jgi:hypothetical protein
MKALLYGIAVLPFLATFATAEPLQLSSNQMDKVTAGFRYTEVDTFNTGSTAIAVYPTAATLLPACPACFLSIDSPTIQLRSFMPSTPGQTNPFPPYPTGPLGGP